MNNSNWLPYLVELRKRLLICLVALAIITLALLPFSNYLYHCLAIPLLKLLPNHGQLIATGLPTAFFIPLKFTIAVAIALIIPFSFFQLWRFIAPGLYTREKKWLWIILLLSSCMFYLGVVFAYFVVFPFLFKFFIQTTPAGVMLMPDISQYFDLTLQVFFAFGLAFEVPVIILVLISLNIVSYEKIAKLRRYFIVAAFIIALFVTPPDVVSQTLFAVPLCLLFEFGLLLAKLLNQPSSLSHEKNISG